MIASAAEECHCQSDSELAVAVAVAIFPPLDFTTSEKVTFVNVCVTPKVSLTKSVGEKLMEGTNVGCIVGLRVGTTVGTKEGV